MATPTDDESSAIEAGPLPNDLLNAALAAGFDRTELDDRPLGPLASTVDERESRYVFEGELARGGMGVVLRARDLGLDRELAMKVSVPGAAERRGMLRRFVTEARICGRLQHPGIVPVYELGRLPDGRLYFTMKLVQGKTLASLLAERTAVDAEAGRFVSIFQSICQTVAYAHDQGVIHRDLKPSNVMVGSFGEVQVLDWGLAKDLAFAEEDHGDGTADETPAADGAPGMTVAGSVFGTPGYTAPELARGESHRVGPPTDAFGLGAILCEILTGQPPFTGASSEALQRARDGDVGEVRARLAECGGPADLVVLASACLDPEVNRRPPDGQAVAEAVGRHLASVAERLRSAELDEARKAAAALVERRRRRLRAWLVAVVLLALFAATAIKLASAARESEARAKTTRMNAYLRGILEWFDPSEVLAPSISLRELVDEAARRARIDLADDPLLASEVIATLGEKYVAMGAYEAGRAELEQALASMESLHGPGSRALVPPLRHLAEAYRNVNEYEASERVFQRALGIARREWGEDSVETAKILALFGLLLKERGDHDQAIDVLRRAITGLRDTAGEELMLGEALSNLSLVLRQLGRAADAISPAEEALDLVEGLHGELHLDVAAACNNLALILRDLGRFDEAEPLYRRSLAIRTRLLGEKSPQTAIGQNNLGQFLVRLGRLGEAEDLFRTALETRRELLGTHEHTANALENRAAVLLRQGRKDQAVEACREALAMRIEILGERHENVARSRSNLALALIEVGEFDEAEGHARECLSTLEELGRRDSTRGCIPLMSLAKIAWKRGELEEADGLFRESLAMAERWWGSANPFRSRMLEDFGAFLLDRGEIDEAERTYREAADILAAALPDGNWQTGAARLHLAEALLRKGECGAAEEELLRSLEALRIDASTPEEEEERAVTLLEDARECDEVESR